MRKEKVVMGMKAIVEVVDESVSEEIFEKVFDYFDYANDTFSTFKKESEISRINSGEISKENYSVDMQEIFKLAEKTKEDTNGYYDILAPDGKYDPLGIVKGWAIHNGAKILKEAGYENFMVEISGDVETCGHNTEGKLWQIGIRNPFNFEEIIKVVVLCSGEGLATSGTYMNGQHIYNPKEKGKNIEDIISLTVIGPNVYEADRLATPVFAMGKEGIYFLEKFPGVEGYMIDMNGLATMTTGFEQYVVQ